MKTTVIYHKADFDGLFCREIARKFLPEAELIGWDFGDPLVPMPIDGTVYILDLSPDCLAPTPGGETVPHWDRIIWIDHHKSAIEKYTPDFGSSNIPGYRIDGVAACRLAWQWFMDMEQHREQGYDMPNKEAYVNRTVTEPLAVRLAGEYDIWDKRDPLAETFQHGLRSQNLDGMWPLLLSTEGDWPVKAVTSLLNAGTGIQYATTHQNESIIKAAGFAIQFEGLTFLACNHARYNSQLFTAGLKPEHDACFGFAWRDGKWNVSLYHAPGKEQHDLSAIATKYGGGGHRGACGFRIDKLPFLP